MHGNCTAVIRAVCVIQYRVLYRMHEKSNRPRYFCFRRAICMILYRLRVDSTECRIDRYWPVGNSCYHSALQNDGLAARLIGRCQRTPASRMRLAGSAHAPCRMRAPRSAPSTRALLPPRLGLKSSRISQFAQGAFVSLSFPCPAPACRSQ